MKLTLKTMDLDALRADLADFSDRRFAAGLATALTRTAVEVKQAQLEEFGRAFDRPTPWTMGSVFVQGAKADALQAQVWVKDDRAGSGTPASNYLLPQIEGGARRVKRFEVALRAAGALPPGMLAVPGAGAQLDAYGNLSRGQIVQILSQLRITLVSGATRNMGFPARGAKLSKQDKAENAAIIRAQRKAGGRFFVVPPGRAGAAAGIYQREFSGRNVTPVVLFVRAATYAPRLQWDRVASRVAEERLPQQIDRAMAEQAARLRGKA